MRVVFMGTPHFAVPSLEALIARYDLVGVCTRPDALTGRGRRLASSPVKQAALAAGVPVLQPRTFRDATAVADLAALRPDVVGVAAYGLLLPRAVLEIPPHGCINVHASLLPAYRGAAPIERAILAGEAVTGVTIMRMDEGLDTGDWAAMESVAIDDLYASEVSDSLADMGARMLLDVLSQIESGRVVWRPQPKDGATYADKLARNDVALNPLLPLETALRRVRASSPHAPAKCSVLGVAVTVQRASRSEVSVPPSAVVAEKHRLLLGFADGSMDVQTLTPEGRGAMDGTAFARGRRASVGTWEAIG